MAEVTPSSSRPGLFGSD